MKGIIRRTLALLLASVMVASLCAAFTLTSAANDYQAGKFDLTVSGTHPHDMSLTIEQEAIHYYDQSQHLTLLLNYFKAKSKTEVRLAENALSGYLSPIQTWLESVSTASAAAFATMYSDILSEARTYYNANNSLTGFTPSYGVTYRIYWERASATAADMANDERTYYGQATNRPSFDASYIKSTTFEDLSDLTKTSCLRAKVAVKITNSSNASGVTYNAYSNEVQIAPQTYVAPTSANCTEPGLEGYYICSECGEKISFYTNGQPNNHTANGTASVHLMVMDETSLIVDEPLGHNYQPTETPPTCLEGGYTTYVCSRCGDTYVDDEVPAAGHAWDDGVVTTPATCSSEGVMLYTCTRCQVTKEEPIQMLPHTVAEGAEWQYAADGSYRYHVCTVCSAETDIEEPTALTFPYTQTCGQYKLHGTTVELDHNYPKFDTAHYIDLHFDYKEENDATLKAEKLALRNAYKAFFVNWFTINYRADTLTRVTDYIEADTTTRAMAEQYAGITYNYNVQFHLNNNTYKQLYALEGSAEQPDYNYANTVSAIDFSVRPQNGEYDYDLIDKCIIGVYARSYYGNGYYSSAYVARLDLSFTTITKYPQAVAVCGSTGYAQDVYYCAACGNYYSYRQPDGTPYTVLCEDGVTRLQLTEIDISDYLIDPPAASHNFAGAVTLEPTCTEEGVRTFTCLNCGYSYTLPIEALGHDMQNYTVAPTCTEPGANVYGCTRCDYIETSEPIPATGHNYIATVVAPTCTEDGYTSYVCATCNDAYTDNETAATGHTIDTSVWYYMASDPDVQFNRPSRWHICSVCGEVCDKEVPTHHPIPWNGNSNYHDTKVTQPMDFPRFDTAEYVALYNAYLALPEGAEKDAAYEQALGYKSFHRTFACMSNAYWTVFDAMVNAIEADPAYALANGYGVTYYYDILKGSGSSAVSINTLDGVTDHSFTNVEVFDFSIRPRVSDYPYNSSWNYRSVLYAQLYYGTAQAPLQVEYTSIGSLFLQTLNEVEPTCGTDGCRPYFYCSNNSCRSYFSFYSDADTINYVTCADGVVREQMVNLGRSQNTVKQLLKVPATGAHTAGDVWYYDPAAPQRYHLCTVCGAQLDVQYIPTPTITVLRSDNCDPHYYNTTISQPQDFPRFDTAEFVALYNAYLALEEGDEKQAALDQVTGYALFHKYIIGGQVGNPAYRAFESLIDAIKADPDNAVANGLGVTYFYDWKFGDSDDFISTFDGVTDHSFTNVALFDFSVMPRVTSYDFSTNDYYRGGLFSVVTYDAQGTSEIFNSVPYELFMFAPNEHAAVEPANGENGHAIFWECQNCHVCFSIYSDGTTLNTVVCDDGVERLKLTVVGNNPAQAEAALAISAGGVTPGDINGDGELTVADVSALLDAIATTQALNMAVADLTGDGEISVADVSALLDLLASM